MVMLTYRVPHQGKNFEVYPFPDPDTTSQVEVFQGCDLDLGADLENLLAKRVQNLSTPDHDAEKLKNVNKNICAHLKHELEIRRLEKLADTNGWPALVDFKDIVNRTLSLKDELADIIFCDYDPYNCVTWDNFLESIDYKIHEFGASMEPYGHGGSAPCNMWIDMGVSYIEAIEIREKSAEYGEMFHWDDKSPHLKSIDEENFAAGRDEYPFPEIPRTIKDKPSSLPATTSSPKHSKEIPKRQANSSMEEVEVTLEDFPPRVFKSKSKSSKSGETGTGKSSEAARPEKEKKEKSAPKENPVRSDYGTRSRTKAHT
ncbi:hypothetical protein MVEN_01620800 [Mycena venus]|uniref:Uncharacterized protein n=1 Tax=Mycena venus TaxID=2733690 RepID=A0A8H6XT66_9AGAR|nr:hypothetical protein MVEN_01620800 [Mycena venus]